MEVAAFRIVTEAVTNTVRHASATRCEVRIDAVDGRFRIMVSDDGRGIDAAQSPGSGHGLETMRERAAELRGSLSVQAGSGTTVTAELPLHPGPSRALAEAPR